MLFCLVRSLHYQSPLFADKGQLKNLEELTERRLRLLGKPISTKSKPTSSSSKPKPVEALPQPSAQKAELVDRMFDFLRLGLLEDYHVLLMQKVTASIPIMDDRVGELNV